MGKNRIKPMTREQINKYVPRILESQFWLENIKADTMYRRIHDDCDGKPDGIEIFIEYHTGDIFLDTTEEDRRISLRFRNTLGGTVSPRTHNALKILALAIKLNEEKFPQKKKVTSV